MKRSYSGDVESSAVTFFTGVEIEKTPALGMPTLFVVGIQPLPETLRLAQLHDIKHIYLGANHSFDGDEEWAYFINSLLDLGFYVTLDYDARYHQYVVYHGFNRHGRFIGMVSVKLPNLADLNNNACIKLDDRDFRASNAGVWVHQLADLQTPEHFTEWSQYSSDVILSHTADPLPEPQITTDFPNIITALPKNLFNTISASSISTAHHKHRYIVVRTEFEGFHHYPGAGEIDQRISFLEHRHRHMFKVTVKISVTHLDRELEFFLVKWELRDYLSQSDQNNKSCEMIADDILHHHLIPRYGADRIYEVTVSEDGESDGVITYTPVRS